MNLLSFAADDNNYSYIFMMGWNAVKKFSLILILILMILSAGGCVSDNNTAVNTREERVAVYTNIVTEYLRTRVCPI